MVPRAGFLRRSRSCCPFPSTNSRTYQWVVAPPSITRDAPLMNDASSAQRKVAELATFLCALEAFNRGFGEHDLLDYLVFGDPVRPGLVGDLILHQRRAYVGGADAVRRHALGTTLQGD